MPRKALVEVIVAYIVAQCIVLREILMNNIRIQLLWTQPKLGEPRKIVCYDVFGIYDVFWFMLNVWLTYDVIMLYIDCVS
jgi:hypothetical protein